MHRFLTSLAICLVLITSPVAAQAVTAQPQGAFPASVRYLTKTKPVSQGHTDSWGASCGPVYRKGSVSINGHTYASSIIFIGYDPCSTYRRGAAAWINY